MRFSLLVFSLVLLFSCGNRKNTTINVAVAANAVPVLEELIEIFSDSTGIAINLIPGSSGKLFTQITQGAPYDLYLSANTDYPEKAFELGFGKEVPVVYCRGKLVLWSSVKQENKEAMDWLSQDCAIAIANPKHAPYGLAGMQVLESLNALEQLNPRLVYAENVSQCNQFIITGNACMGFGSLSTVLLEEYKDFGDWIELDTSLYSPIQQGMLRITDNPDAIAFYTFLQSDQAKLIFNKRGYSSSNQVQS